MIAVGILQTLILAAQAVILYLTIRILRKQNSTAMNAQRAWVTVDVKHDDTKWADEKTHILKGTTYTSDGNGGTTGGDNTSFYAVLICKNEGSSPGWIEEKRARFEIVTSLPPGPELRSAQVIQTGPMPLGPGQTDELRFVPVAKGRQEEGKNAVIYGVVRYRDIFGKHRQTTFAYKLLNNELSRLEGYPEYNRNT
jgi:hypothetical protein